jgi:hypothetical protein
VDIAVGAELAPRVTPVSFCADFDHAAMAWRVTVDGEVARGSDGLPLRWFSFSAAYAFKEQLRREAGYGSGMWGRGL